MDELQKEYDKAFTQGFTSEQLKKNLDRAIKGDFQDDWQRELDERKKAYRSSGKGIDLNKERTDEEEDERMQLLAKNIAKKTEPLSNDVAGIYLPSAYGADIEAEQVFQQELHGIVDDMKVKLVDEKKILEGTLVVEYGKGEWGLPHIERTISDEDIEKNDWLFEGPKDQDYGKHGWRTCVLKNPNTENELSNSNPLQEQWKSDSPNGSLTIDPTPILVTDSSNSSSIVELSTPNCPTVPLRRLSTSSLINSCSENLDDCGNETDAMNEFSECTVPMINEQMLGTPNEAR